MSTNILTPVCSWTHCQFHVQAFNVNLQSFWIWISI